jgi:hypothetical protein
MCASLSNILDRALSTMKGEVIDAADLPFPESDIGRHRPLGVAPIRDGQADAEKAAIVNRPETDR